MADYSVQDSITLGRGIIGLFQGSLFSYGVWSICEYVNRWICRVLSVLETNNPCRLPGYMIERDTKRESIVKIFTESRKVR